jgi:hypothetical protein
MLIAEISNLRARVADPKANAYLVHAAPPATALRQQRVPPMSTTFGYARVGAMSFTYWAHDESCDAAPTSGYVGVTKAPPSAAARLAQGSDREK